MRGLRLVIGFAAGVIATVLAEALLLGLFNAMFGGYSRMTGLGWYALPGFVGVGVARYARDVDLTGFNISPTFVRLFLVGCISWWLCVLAYLWVVHPYGTYAPIENAFDSMRGPNTWRWLLVPPLLAGLIAYMFELSLRAGRGRETVRTLNSASEGSD